MPSQTLYYIVTGIIGGILLSSVFTIFISEFVILVLIFGTSYVLVWTFSFSSYYLNKSSGFVGIILLGILLGMFRVSLWSYFNHPGLLHDFDGQKVEVQGIVIEQPTTSDSSQKVIVNVNLITQNKKTIKIDNEALTSTLNRYEQINYGDEIVLTGTLKSPKPIVDNNGTFAYDTYLARQGIFMTMVLPQVKVVAQHKGSRTKEFLYSVKQWFVDRTVQALPYPESGLFTGLVISGKSGLSKDDQSLFTRVGIVHIVALSGTNVTIIVEALMLLLFFVPKKFRLGIGACGIGG